MDITRVPACDAFQSRLVLASMALYNQGQLKIVPHKHPRQRTAQESETIAKLSDEGKPAYGCDGHLEAELVEDVAHVEKACTALSSREV
eukprot:4969543-Amphidinium_carterae.1